ncbi:MAG: hypothetical protein AAFQ89_12690 [Cyanobacteria bacterium J06626_18]
MTGGLHIAQLAVPACEPATVKSSGHNRRAIHGNQMNFLFTIRAKLFTIAPFAAVRRRFPTRI